MKIDSITIKSGQGEYIGHAIDTAMKAAKSFDCVVMFSFGKVNMAVTKHDTKQELMEYYNYRFDEVNK